MTTPTPEKLIKMSEEKGRSRASADLHKMSSEPLRESGWRKRRKDLDEEDTSRLRMSNRCSKAGTGRNRRGIGKRR